MGTGRYVSTHASWYAPYAVRRRAIATPTTGAKMAIVGSPDPERSSSSGKPEASRPANEVLKGNLFVRRRLEKSVDRVGQDHLHV